MKNTLTEHYLCPEECVRLQPAGQFSDEEGYFRFGHTAVCYGRSSSGFRRSKPQADLYDVLPDVLVDNNRLGIPFDVTEVIDNLRLERYSQGAQGMNVQVRRLLKDAYYRVRPFIPASVRSWIQRLDSAGWQTLRFPRWPVDTTVEIICEELLRLTLTATGIEKIPFVWFWPEGAQTCITMTHDVEAEPGKRFCGELMDIDQLFEIPASFQVVPEGRYELSQEFVDSIRKRGFELNIQDLNHDGNLFRSQEEFRSRAERINQYGRTLAAHGFRSAVLYRNQQWLDALQFSFDMSVPNVAHLDPQKGGCCTVLPYFIGDKVEIPVTTTQDYMLFHLLRTYSLDLWKEQCDIILRKGGLISFIVHPDYIIEKRARAVYHSLLAYLRDFASGTKTWFARPGEINRWWRARQRMRIVNAGGEWRIEGSGAERAVLAFATLNGNNEIEYQLTSGSGQPYVPTQPSPTL